MLASIAGRVAGLEQERQTGTDSARLERIGDLVRARVSGSAVWPSRTHAELSSRSIEFTTVPSRRDGPRRRPQGRPECRDAGCGQPADYAQHRDRRLVQRAHARASLVRRGSPALPSRSRSLPSSWRSSSRAACTAGVSVIAWRRRCVGTRPSVAPVSHRVPAGDGRHARRCRRAVLPGRSYGLLEWPGAGAPTGLQNPEADATRRLEGSTPSPLRHPAGHDRMSAPTRPLTLLAPPATSTTARPRSIAALTGIDTDRLPEEKSRGISIDLGFAPLRLPSGRWLSIRRCSRP